MKFVQTLLVVVGFGSGLLTSAIGESGTKADTAMKRVVNHYIQLQENLARDAELTDIARAANLLASETAKLKDKKLAEQIRGAAFQVGNSTDIDDARSSFKKLSRPIVAWVEKEKPANLEVVSCSMAGAKWVQAKGDVKNPYYGKSMLSCGEKS